MAALSFRTDDRISSKSRAKLRAFCNTLGGNIIGLANDLGIKVYAEELLPYDSGYLEYAPTCGSSSGYRIVVNDAHPETRQRFSVAHELAHFLLHRESDVISIRSETRHRTNDPFQYLEPEDKLLEREANSFASALLLPPNLFVAAHSGLSGDVDQLAKLFVVSREVVIRRKKELALN